jgi:hypothetical protein
MANGTMILRATVQAQRMNATCERLAGILRHELLDRVLILGEAHLRAVVTEYQLHYNSAQPHQGIAQRVPQCQTRRPAARHDQSRHRGDPPKAGPQRPDQRIRARSLTPVQTAGHLPNLIFERDRLTDGFQRGSVRNPQ